ncbi:MAG: SPOR domain-containing protein [Proteobacteria bacterium]|nr:SPOR domain-containing protein [Pseudomonadota bacterium]
MPARKKARSARRGPTARRGPKGKAGPGWIRTLLGVAILCSSGFLVGLVAGVVTEEPEIVVAHLAGRSEEVPWAAGPKPAAASEVPAPLRKVPLGFAPAQAAPAPPRPPAVATAPPPARQAAQPAAADSGFAVQVGAFAESTAARSLAASLEQKGFPMYVTPAAGSHDGRWRVRVGPLSTRAEADRLAARLKAEESLSTWVLAETVH